MGKCAGLLRLFWFFCWPIVVQKISGNACDGLSNCTSKVFGDKEYYLFTHNQISWDNSKKFCESKNLTLAKVPEGLQHTQFLRSFGKGQQDINVWLGGKVKDLISWKFVNGEIFYKFDGAPGNKIMECFISFFFYF